MNWDLVGISVKQQGDPNYSNENLSFFFEMLLLFFFFFFE